MKSVTSDIASRGASDASRKQWMLWMAIGLLAVAYIGFYHGSEPFFNEDEPRHVLTGVFFRDLFHDLPFFNFVDYTIRYYLQYPGLGLFVWPPFFYFLEGALMSVFGTSFIIAKVMVAGSAVLACLYLFRLVSWTHDADRAAVATLIFGFSPVVFSLSRQVMMEVPTLAGELAATYYFVRYLDLGRRKDLLLATVASALAALTRFDGAYLLPFFLILLLARGQFSILRRTEVLVAGALAALLVFPLYWPTWEVFGSVHYIGVVGDRGSLLGRVFSLPNLLFYPVSVPIQLGWIAVPFALVGLVASLRGSLRSKSWPYLAMVLATVLVFAPMAEKEPRHAIGWVPAFAYFAAEGVFAVSGLVKGRSLRIILASIAIIGTAWASLRVPAPYVRGYEEAAAYVVDHTRSSEVCFFDGVMNADFAYQVRTHDPSRRLWVLSGDNLLRWFVDDPRVPYPDFARGESAILRDLQFFQPEFVVVESPRLKGLFGERVGRLPTNPLQSALLSRPEAFRLVRTVEIRSSSPDFNGTRLEIYQNLLKAKPQIVPSRLCFEWRNHKIIAK